MKNIIATIKAATPTLIKRGIALGVTVSLLHVSLAVAMPKTLVDGAAALGDEAVVSIPADSGIELREMIVQASAYNPGDENQTDNSPCHGPRGIFVCDPNQRIIAANGDFKLGDQVLIDGKIYTVADRMNARYQKGFIDIAIYHGNTPEQMKAAKAEALSFGRRTIKITLLD